MNEEWRPVPGYEAHYEVSDQGRVRSLDRFISAKNGHRQKCHGRILRPGTIGQHRYPAVGLHEGGKATSLPVHRIVLLAFVGPLPKGMHTRHINGDHTDNRLVNLVYGTPTENTADKFRHGTFRTRLTVATHCIHGHEFTPENVERDRAGQRHCKACRRNRDREQKRRARAKGLAPEDRRHGTVSGYRNFACRCTPMQGSEYRLRQAEESSMNDEEFAPLVFVDLIEVPEPKARKLLGPRRSRWQPWRVLVKSGGNQKQLFRGSERWTNLQDALDAIALVFGDGTSVFLRQSEKGNIALRRPA